MVEKYLSEKFSILKGWIRASGAHVSVLSFRAVLRACHRECRGDTKFALPRGLSSTHSKIACLVLLRKPTYHAPTSVSGDVVKHHKFAMVRLTLHNCLALKEALKLIFKASVVLLHFRSHRRFESPHLHRIIHGLQPVQC